MRKRLINEKVRQTAPSDSQDWLELEQLVEVELTSEDAACSIESALTEDSGPGWRAQHPGRQTIRLVFDKPHRIRRIQLLFEENQRERTQEFVLRWSTGGDASYREIVRQQYNFSPPDSGSEFEDYVVDLNDLMILELCIIPDISGGETCASLARLRLA